MSRGARIAAVGAVVLACVSTAQAVDIQTVSVGNPGNAGELSGEGVGGWGPDRICGAVDYVYNIGKFEVTNAQYCEFLNAVTASDPHGLYNTNMDSGHGGIMRDGPSGSYTYSTIAGRANMPVNYVSWYDTLRFANWMHNGKGNGDTEDGAYDMSLGSSVVRKPGALVFLPSEDEWYKAAYYKGGGTSAGYWNYPTETDCPNPPTAEGPPGTDMVNGSANYDLVVGELTDVGAYTAKPSDSAYGTFDQGGNVWEWNEAVIYGSFRGLRGGSLGSDDDFQRAAYRDINIPTGEGGYVGFRVAEVPGPIPTVSEWGLVAMALLVLTAGTVVLARRRTVTAL